VGPFYRHQVATDRFRIAEMTAAREGTPPPDRDPRMTAFLAAAAQDPDAFRGLLEIVLCTAFPEDVMARPAVQSAMARHESDRLVPIPGPDRTRLLQLLAA
jgi:hypothetical protein